MVAALGAVFRLFVRIPVIPDWVELTPAFTFSELGGVIGGIPGGIFVGAVVGVAGAMAGGEVPLLPAIGNICLGIGTGYAIHVTRERDSVLYWVLAIVGGAFIGGFIPTLTIFGGFSLSLEASIVPATIDGLQAALWAFVALVLERTVVRPIAGVYLYPNVEGQSPSSETTEE